MRAAFVLLVSLLVLPPLRAPMAQVSQEQATAIRQLLASTFEKPGSPLSLDPIVVEGDGAVVGWIQGDMAGRLPAQSTGNLDDRRLWGDALKSSSTLERLGLPKFQADKLASSLANAEAAPTTSGSLASQVSERSSRWGERLMRRQLGIGIQRLARVTTGFVPTLSQSQTDSGLEVAAASRRVSSAF